MRGKLVLQKTRHSTTPLRSDEVRGEGGEIVVGERFNLIGGPLDPTKSARWVSTSPVTQIISETPNKIVFKTESSVYDWYPKSEE